MTQRGMAEETQLCKREGCNLPESDLIHHRDIVRDEERVEFQPVIELIRELTEGNPANFCCSLEGCSADGHVRGRALLRKAQAWLAAQPLRSRDEERANGRWSSIEVQQGLTLEQQNWLDDLAHGLVPKEALDWICDLIEQRRRLVARSLDEERAEFEKWAVRQGDSCDRHFCTCTPTNLRHEYYESTFTEWEWRAWLAARGVTQEGR